MHQEYAKMTMRRIAALTGTVLAGFVLAGCATATIEDAVPAGALEPVVMQTSPEAAASPGQDVSLSTEPDAAASATAPAGVYPNLNVPPLSAAPQISEQQKATDKAALRAHQAQLAVQGQQQVLSQGSATLSARASDRAIEAQGNTIPDDGDALRRLADRHIEETLKEIEGR